MQTVGGAPFNPNQNFSGAQPHTSTSGEFLGQQILEHILVPKEFRLYYTVDYYGNLRYRRTFYMTFPCEKAQEWNHLLVRSRKEIHEFLLPHMLANAEQPDNSIDAGKGSKDPELFDYEWHMVYDHSALKEFKEKIIRYNDSMQE